VSGASYDGVQIQLSPDLWERAGSTQNGGLPYWLNKQSAYFTNNMQPDIASNMDIQQQISDIFDRSQQIIKAKLERDRIERVASRICCREQPQENIVFCVL
jgi:hypothetical protein